MMPTKTAANQVDCARTRSEVIGSSYDSGEPHQQVNAGTGALRKVNERPPGAIIMADH